MDTKFPDSLADCRVSPKCPTSIRSIRACMRAFARLISKVFKPSGEDFRFADPYHLSTLVLASWTVNYRVRSGVGGMSDYAALIRPTGLVEEIAGD